MLTRILLLLLLSLGAVASAEPDPVTVNNDVFVCKNGIHGVLRLESQSLYPDTLDRLDSFTDSDLIAGLKALSPRRFQFLKQWIQRTWPHLKFINGISLARETPESPLVRPANCKIKVLASLSAPDMKVIVDQDLFEKLSPQDKELALLEIGLDMEQLAFSYQRWRYGPTRPEGKLHFDQVKSRDFLRCWFTGACAPATLIQFHQLARSHGLGYFEQDGILVVDSPTLQWSHTGLIRSTNRIAPRFSNDLMNSFFHSEFRVREQSYPVTDSDLAIQGMFIKFAEDGRTKCAPVVGADFLGLGEPNLWSTGLSPVGFPVCWASSGQVLQGHLIVPWELPFHLKSGKHALVIRRDPHAGGLDQGTSIVIHDNGQPKWIDRAQGQVVIGSRSYQVDGTVILSPDSIVECARLRNELLTSCFDRTGRLIEKLDRFQLVKKIIAQLEAP